jgi:hypothetical protein
MQTKAASISVQHLEPQVFSTKQGQNLKRVTIKDGTPASRGSKASNKEADWENCNALDNTVTDYTNGQNRQSQFEDHVSRGSR